MKNLEFYRSILTTLSIFILPCYCQAQAKQELPANAPKAAAATASAQFVFPYKEARGFGGSAPNPELKPKDQDLLQIADKGDEDIGDKEAKAELLSIPGLAERETEDVVLGFGAKAQPDLWRPAGALLALRAKLKALAPDRHTDDDGMVGDKRHWEKGSRSDHNPWIKGADGIGVVTAYDITNDLRPEGCDDQALVDSLLKAKDKRIKYIIWNRTIYNSDPIGSAPAWAPRKYTGENAHDKHVHISVLPNPNLYESSADWDISVSKKK